MGQISEDDELTSEPSHHEILTARLRLRTARVSDAPLIYPIISRHEVMRYSTTPPVTSLTQAQRWLKDRVLGPDVFNFALELRSTGEFIGIMGCFHPPGVGYITSPEHTGKGFTTEALKALVPALFEHLPAAGTSGIGFGYLEGRTDPTNLGSRRVLEKSGFRQCEIRENDIDHGLVSLQDTVVYRIARPGRTLEEMGLIQGEIDDSVDPTVMPPVQ